MNSSETTASQSKIRGDLTVPDPIYLRHHPVTTVFLIALTAILYKVRLYRGLIGCIVIVMGGCFFMNSVGLNSKDIVKDLLQRLPDQISLHEIAREIEFVAAVRQGIAEHDRGEGIPIEEVESELPTWVIK